MDGKSFSEQLIQLLLAHKKLHWNVEDIPYYVQVLKYIKVSLHIYRSLIHLTGIFLTIIWDKYCPFYFHLQTLIGIRAAHEQNIVEAFTMNLNAGKAIIRRKNYWAHLGAGKRARQATLLQRRPIGDQYEIVDRQLLYL